MDQPISEAAHFSPACLFPYSWFAVGTDETEWRPPLGLLHQYPPGRNLGGNLCCSRTIHAGRAGSDLSGRTVRHRVAAERSGLAPIERAGGPAKLPGVAGSARLLRFHY